jgi:hypothetical protein
MERAMSAEIIELKTTRRDQLDAKQLAALHRADLAVAALIGAWCEMKNMTGDDEYFNGEVVEHYFKCTDEFIKAHDEIEKLKVREME